MAETVPPCTKSEDALVRAIIGLQLIQAGLFERMPTSTNDPDIYKNAYGIVDFVTRNIAHIRLLLSEAQAGCAPNAPATGDIINYLNNSPGESKDDYIHRVINDVLSVSPQVKFSIFIGTTPNNTSKDNVFTGYHDPDTRTPQPFRPLFYSLAVRIGAITNGVYMYFTSNGYKFAKIQYYIKLMKKNNDVKLI